MASDIGLNTVLERSTGLPESSTADDDTVLVGIQQATFYNLQGPVSSRIWQLLGTPTTVAQLVDALTADFEVDRDTCERDTVGFVQQLVQQGLLRIVRDSARPGRQAFVQPAPHGVIENFLGADTVNRLLQYCASRADQFIAAEVGEEDHGRVDERIRVSRRLTDLAEFQDVVMQRLRQHVPQMVSNLRLSPFDAEEYELEIVAHGDGAFFATHIDTIAGASKPPMWERMISAVYYFFNVPKAFSGGALRLYPLLDARGGSYVDVEPVQDGLVYFPSWAPHEVRPIASPSRRFDDSRFAINCWICRRNPSLAG